MNDTPLQITAFSDFACPYCYVTEAALWLRDPGEVALGFRAFELFPAPGPTLPPDDEPGWRERVAPLAEQVGVRFAAPSFRPRTRKAHEAARFARQRGLEREMRVALFAAFWWEERDIGRIDVLMEVIGELGVDPEDLKIALDIDQYGDAVVGDQELARRLRITAVPTLFLGTGPTARVLVGAQSPEALDRALRACL